MQNNKSGILHGKIGYYNVDQLSSNIIKYKNDLLIVESILKAKNKKNIK